MKTFLDSSVLLTAWRGEASAHSQAALAVMADDRRQFYTSDNVRLELLPKPTFEKRRVEVEFYLEHFDTSVASEPFSAELGEAALSLAKRYGLSAGDSLNLAAAVRQGVEEFITSELPGRPLFRVAELSVISLRAIRF